MREVTLPSGATLKIQVSPFTDSKALYQALLTELKAVHISAAVDMAALYKDLFCTGFSSPLIERCLWKCFERCTVEGLKIDKDTFEAIERRDDYMTVCLEVTKDNVGPFAKSLFAGYSEFLTMTEGTQKSKQQTTTS